MTNSQARSIPGSRHEHSRRHGPYNCSSRHHNTTTPEYEYIVVGSGPGGGPVAANLAIAGFKVLLIDAGGDHGNGTQPSPSFYRGVMLTRRHIATNEVVPALHFLSSEFEETAWTFFPSHYDDIDQQKKDSKMVYQLSNGSRYIGLYPPADAEPLGIDYPRAGTLGGCSRHNAMLTIYPHDSDWTYIANLTGDDSWSADKMRGHFETIEDNRYVPSSVIGHGYKGWLTTSVTYLGLVLKDFKFLNLVLSAASASGTGFLGTAVSTITELGAMLALDINAPGQTSQPGLYQVPIAMKDGVRASPRDLILNTANALKPDGSRKYHLDIKLDTLV